MTNLEAADLLDNLIGMVSDNHDSDYDEALSKGRDILKSEPCEDATLKDIFCMGCEYKEQEPKTGHWIPVSERLPDNTDPVNITWVNHDPDSYYADIKDKPFTATGHYCNGRWWWYSATCQDYLNEYGRCDADDMDDVIEVIAWMPLPEPYREVEE